MADEFRLAAPHELPAVFELRARAFQRGTPSEWAADLDQDPWRDAGADFVALADGRIVATLRVVARQMAGSASALRVAGFAAVASDPAVRGQGYISRLLAIAHERARSAGNDLAMLFTGSPWVYSGSAGFAVLPLAWLDFDVRRVPVPPAEWTIEPLDPSRHMPAIRHVYELFGQGRLGYPVRGDAYWLHPAAAPNDAHVVRVAVDRYGQVAAYVRVRFARDGRAVLEEFPYLVGDAAVALAAQLGRDPRLAQSARVGGGLPRDHVLGDSGVWSMRESTMVCAYTPAGTELLAALRDPANQRSVYWSGDAF